MIYILFIRLNTFPNETVLKVEGFHSQFQVLMKEAPFGLIISFSYASTVFRETPKEPANAT